MSNTITSDFAYQSDGHIDATGFQPHIDHIFSKSIPEVHDKQIDGYSDKNIDSKSTAISEYHQQSPSAFSNSLSCPPLFETQSQSSQESKKWPKEIKLSLKIEKLSKYWRNGYMHSFFKLIEETDYIKEIEEIYDKYLGKNALKKFLASRLSNIITFNGKKLKLRAALIMFASNVKYSIEFDGQIDKETIEFFKIKENRLVALMEHIPNDQEDNDRSELEAIDLDQMTSSEIPNKKMKPNKEPEIQRDYDKIAKEISSMIKERKRKSSAPEVSMEEAIKDILITKNMSKVEVKWLMKLKPDIYAALVKVFDIPEEY